MSKIICYTDGGARGNPGPAAVGVVIKLQDSLTKNLHSFGKVIGENTNNFAEYMAVVEALKWLIENRDQFLASDGIEFFLDSKLVVNQINGLFKIKKQELVNLYYSVKEMEKKLGIKITYSYIPREKNVVADRLVNQALDE